MIAYIEARTGLFTRMAYAGTEPYEYEDEVVCDAEPEAGSYWDGKQFIAPPAPQTPPAPAYPVVSAIEYKLLFTALERIAIKTSTDPVIADLYELINDQRVTHVDLGLASVQHALDYMTEIGILAPGRKEEILTGVVR